MRFEKVEPHPSVFSEEDCGEPVTVTLSCAGKSQIYTDLRLGIIGMASSAEDETVEVLVLGNAPRHQTIALCEVLISIIAKRGILEEALYQAVEAEDKEEHQLVTASLAKLMTVLRDVQRPNPPKED